MNQFAYPNAWLTTLDALKLHRGINTGTVPAEGKYSDEEIDALLTACILDASASIVDELARLPLPHRMTAKYPGVYGRCLFVPDDLLEVIEVINAADGTVDPALYELGPSNRYPKLNIDLLRNDTYPFWWSANSPTQTITVDGIFGYVPHWQRAWKPSGQVLPTGGINPTETIIGLPTVSAFRIGGYGRIEDEYIQIVGRNDEDDEITLERGVLGTAAAGHAQNTVIELFVQHADIQAKATEWAGFLWKSLDNLGEEVKVFADGVEFVKGLSPLIKRALRKHKRL